MPTLPVAEVVSLRKRGADFRYAGRLARERGERDELVHDYVPVALEALEPAARRSGSPRMSGRKRS